MVSTLKTMAAVAALMGVALAAPYPPMTPEEIRTLLRSYNLDLTDMQMGAVTRCVLDQTDKMAAVSSFKLFQNHWGPAPGYPGKYAEEPVANIVGLNKLDPTDPHPNLGSYDACTFSEGKFCYTFLADEFLGWESMVTSMCVPKNCSAPDIQLLEDLIMKQMMPANASLGELTVLCKGDEQKYSEDDGAQAMFGILMAIVAIAVVATFLARMNEYIPQWRKGDVEETEDLLKPEERTVAPADERKPAKYEGPLPQGLYNFILCWDLSTSFDAWTTISPPQRNTNFLNGMRVLSISWVMLGHAMYFVSTNIPGFDNKTSDILKPIIDNYRSVLLASGLYAVETFFFMSGFLACYLFLGAKAKRAWGTNFSLKQAARNLGLTWLARYVRLTPLYALVIFSNYYLLEYLMEGPYSVHFKHGGHFGGFKCKNYWYYNLLYIQNLFTREDLNKQFCFGHSWYLAVDMQFLVFGSMIMVGYIYRPKPAMVLTLALIVMSLIMTVLFLKDPINIFNMGMYNYNKPYIRPAPYLLGMICGYVVSVHLQKVKDIVASWKVRMGLYLTAFVLMWGDITLAWAAFRQAYSPEMAWTVNEGRAYQVAFHLCWGLGLSMLTLCWVCGHGGLVKKFLSHPLWEPLGRCTFGVYLIHPMVQMIIVVGLAQGPAVHYTNTWYMVLFVSSWVGSFLAGILCFHFVERPAGAMYTLGMKSLMGSGKRRKPVEEDKPADGAPATPEKPANTTEEA